MIRTSKNMNGWKATSEYPLRDNLVLDVMTSKNSNGSVSTFISVSRVRPVEGSPNLVTKTHMVFDDYAKSYKHDLKGNLTEKKVIAFHEDALVEVKAVHIDRALEHYKNRT